MQQIFLIPDSSSRPLITRLLVPGGYRYLWLKYVTDVNLQEHCINSLIGRRCRKLSPKEGVYQDILLDESPASIMYLCGVSYPYYWTENFHLAFQHKVGKELTFQDKGFNIQIKNAQRLNISPNRPIHHPKTHDRKFSTCRNWQFAIHFAQTGGNPSLYKHR